MYAQFERMFTLLGGTDPSVRGRIDVTMVGDGFLFSGVAPQLSGLPTRSRATISCGLPASSWSPNDHQQ